MNSGIVEEQRRLELVKGKLKDLSN